MQPRLFRGTAASTGHGVEPIEVGVRRNAHEDDDRLRAYDGMVVGEERTEGVHPTRENEGR